MREIQRERDIYTESERERESVRERDKEIYTERESERE